jgi:hypothetical protein
VFADAALRELHNLAIASAQFERAAKDSDDIGCRNAYESMQKVAHEALTNMHYMSFAPIDAIADVSSLLRVSHLAPNECANDELAPNMHMLLLIAGQAIMELRYDYAIGDGDWYSVKASGDIETKNPLRYAQSLKDHNYAWVSVRPKAMILMVELDWKAEMASHEVDDPSIENSGNNLKAVGVDYRKNSDDNYSTVYFYRTKEDALAAKRQADDDAQTAAELKASNAAWRQKLASLQYMVPNHDVGFKLVYDVCKPAGKNAAGEITCNADGSHDWSDNRSVPYHWFSDIQGCEDTQLSINTKHPADVKVEGDDAFMSYCVPASKMSGHTLRGYVMVFALSPPGAADGDDVYTDLRESGSQTATVFKTFKACYDAMDTAYSKIMKDLGVDEDGNLLSDKTKSISLTASCVRVY